MGVSSYSNGLGRSSVGCIAIPDLIMVLLSMGPRPGVTERGPVFVTARFLAWGSAGLTKYI